MTYDPDNECPACSVPLDHPQHAQMHAMTVGDMWCDICDTDDHLTTLHPGSAPTCTVCVNAPWWMTCLSCGKTGTAPTVTDAEVDAVRRAIADTSDLRSFDDVIRTALQAAARARQEKP